MYPKNITENKSCINLHHIAAICGMKRITVKVSHKAAETIKKIAGIERSSVAVVGGKILEAALPAGGKK